MDLHRVLQQIQYPDDTSGGRSERQETDLQERAAEVDSGQPPTVRCAIIVFFKCCIHWWGTLKPQLCKLPNPERSSTIAKEKYSLSNWHYLEKVAQKNDQIACIAKSAYFFITLLSSLLQNVLKILVWLHLVCYSPTLLYDLTSRTQTSTSLVGPRSSFELGR